MTLFISTPSTLFVQLVGGRLLGQYTDIAEHYGCDGHTLDNLVGYVIRQTVQDGEVLWCNPERTRCGVDVAVIDDPREYAQAIEYVHTLRSPGQYAVVDSLYGCGHRSK